MIPCGAASGCRALCSSSCRTLLLCTRPAAVAFAGLTCSHMTYAASLSCTKNNSKRCNTRLAVGDWLHPSIQLLLLEFSVCGSKSECCHLKPIGSLLKVEEVGFVPGTTHLCYKSNGVHFLLRMPQDQRHVVGDHLRPPVHCLGPCAISPASVMENCIWAFETCTRTDIASICISQSSLLRFATSGLNVHCLGQKHTAWTTWRDRQLHLAQEVPLGQPSKRTLLE